jgi:hypothetical protein
MDRPLPWLRYLEASEVDDDSIDFDGLKLRTAGGEDLGSIEGFIVDADSARPYYVVVDAGGWFRSKHFLVPVGHVRVDADEDALVTSLTRERVKRFPGFDFDRFDKLTDDDLKRMNDQICEMCGITVITYSSEEPFDKAWSRPDFAYPDWWHAAPSLPDRMGESAYQKPVEYPEQPRAEARDMKSKPRRS